MNIFLVISTFNGKDRVTKNYELFIECYCPGISVQSGTFPRKLFVQRSPDNMTDSVIESPSSLLKEHYYDAVVALLVALKNILFYLAPFHSSDDYY